MYILQQINLGEYFFSWSERGWSSEVSYSGVVFLSVTSFFFCPLMSFLAVTSTDFARVCDIPSVISLLETRSKYQGLQNPLMIHHNPVKIVQPIIALASIELCNGW